MTQEITTAKRGFAPGHPRFGGKGKGSASRVRQLVEELGPNSDPIRFMLLLIKNRTYEQVTIDANGKRKKNVVPASLDLILDACRTTAQYLVPKLSAVAHSAPDGPLNQTTVEFDTMQILANPELCAAAQQIALAMADASASGQPKQLPAPMYSGLRGPDHE